MKWAGGKSQLIEQLEVLLPKDLAQRKGLTYVEPFVGGGAMLFYVLGKYTNIALRVGFQKSYEAHDYAAIVAIAKKLPADVVETDEKLIRYYDRAQLHLED